MTINALLIYDSQMNQRTFGDWLMSHISGALPPHRYIGEIELHEDSIRFEGIDIKSSEREQFIISKSAISQVYFGYDKIYTIWQTRGLGLNWAPVRLQLSLPEQEQYQYLYIITGYNLTGSANKTFYQYLTDWLSR